MVKVVMGDAHPLFVDVLSTVLTECGYEVAHGVLTRGALIDALRRERPDLCLLDHRSLAGSDIDAFLDELTTLARAQHTKLVVVSTGPTGPRADSAAALGVDGVLDKRAGLNVLLDGLRRVLGGETVTEVPPRRGVCSDEATRVQRRAADLTARERECLALLVKGHTTAHIVRTLSISETTVRSHVRSLLRKLGAHSRLEAASLVMRYQLLADELETPRAG
jgi:two-component system nitrate/nitrite response regulator NarL